MTEMMKKIDGWKTILGATVLLLILPVAQNHGWAMPADVEAFGKWAVAVGLLHRAGKWMGTGSTKIDLTHFGNK